MSNDELITSAQVAAMFGKPVGTINRWANEGRLPVAQRLPGRTGANLFARNEVEALLNSRSRNARGVSA